MNEISIPSNFSLEEALSLCPVHPVIQAHIDKLLDEASEFEEIQIGFDNTVREMDREILDLTEEVDKLKYDLKVADRKLESFRGES